MKLNLTEKKENKFLDRLEVHGSLTFEGATPSTAQITQALVADLQVAPEVLVIKHIYTKYGRHEADVVAYAYSSAERRQHIEPVTAHQKKKVNEAKKEEKKEASA